MRHNSFSESSGSPVIRRGRSQHADINVCSITILGETRVSHAGSGRKILESNDYHLREERYGHDIVTDRQSVCLGGSRQETQKTPATFCSTVSTILYLHIVFPAFISSHTEYSVILAEEVIGLYRSTSEGCHILTAHPSFALLPTPLYLLQPNLYDGQGKAKASRPRRDFSPSMVLLLRTRL